MTQALVKKTETLQGLLKQMQPQMQAVLPPGMMAQRMARVALTTVQRNPKLMECTPISIVAAVLESCQLGLSLDDNLGHAYLVPYGKEAQLQIGYKGLVELAWRSAEILITAGVVCENDQFIYQEGTTPRLEHQPAWKNRGESIGAWAVAQIPDGRTVQKFCDLDEIQRAESLSKGTRKDRPWITHRSEMMMKTAVRRLCKLLPMGSCELQRAATLDEMAESGISQGLSAQVDLGSLDVAMASNVKQQELAAKLEAEKNKPKGRKTTQKPPKSTAGKAKKEPEPKTTQKEQKPAQADITQADIDWTGKDK